jgi:hypothetical protein
VAIKAVDEVGNTAAISNVPTSSATPAGAADGMIVYGESTLTTPKYRLWYASGTWGSEASAPAAGSVIQWVVTKSAPVVRNQKIIGVLSSDNSLKFAIWYGTSSVWSDITPSPSPATVSITTRRFDIAAEMNSGRIMTAYYNNSAGAVTYAVYSTTASAWVDGPTSVPMASLTGTVNWVRLKSMPGTDRIALAVLDSNSDISAAIWNGSSWIDNVNLTASASIATEESFDIAWETLTGDLLALWGTGTTTNYRKWYSTTGTWAPAASAGPNIAATANWIRLCSDLTSNRIGFTSLDGGSDWNVSIWRPSSTEGWSALPTEDAAMSGNAFRQTDCAWEAKSGEFLAVAVDDLGTTDNKFDWITWSGGTWSPASPSVTAANNNTVLVGNITYLGLVPDPNTDNITAYAIDSSSYVKSTVWDGTGWAAAGASSNFEHEQNVSASNYEPVSLDFDRHDNVPPTLVDNQTGDAVWRNQTGYYNVDVNDSGGSQIAQIKTKVYSAAAGGGTLLQNWTAQISGINLDSYSTDWPLTQATFDLLYQGTNYVWVQAFDNAGNESIVISDAFYIKKDTTAPTITNNHSAGFDQTWRNSDAGAIYNVDFYDIGGSQISSMTYSAWTGTQETGTNSINNAIIASGTAMGNSYTQNWSVNFVLLAHGTNYITVRVWDWATSSATIIDAFKVLKDTQVPGNITSLIAAAGPTRGSIKLEWTAPGDDGTINNNTQGGYIVKYATYNITEVLFDSASTYSQTWVPQNAGLLESKILYGFEVGKTYYFAVKTYDKANSTSAISNVPSTLPQTANVYINEVYAAGASAADDWIELYNTTADTFTLTGWTIVYNQGSIDVPGLETTVWTGADVDRSSVNVTFLITPSVNLNGAQSYHVLLKDNNGNLIDKVQWPILSSGQSFARISDGNADFFETDPTRTRGYANSISTEPAKINEVSYGTLSDEFIELYNTGDSTPTLSGWSLRNSNSVEFGFTRKIYAKSYTGLAYTSMGQGAITWTSAFGSSGMNASGDYLALENNSGQVIDRVVWQSGTNYTLRNYKSALVSASAFAPANSTVSIGRQPQEGSDTEVDSTDFISMTSTTFMSRNNNAGTGLANTLSYPADNQFLPKKFKIDLTLGQNSVPGAGDNIVFIRTGGLADNYSPHIYRLSDIGFDLTSLSVQTTIQTGISFNDQDGYPLVNGTIYRLILNSDSSSASAPQIIRSTLTYDSSVHTATAFNTASVRLGTNTKNDMLKFGVSNNSPSGYNSVEITSVAVSLRDSNLNPLTNVQAQNLLKEILVVRDSTSGIVGTYESAIDTVTIGRVLNSSFDLDINGRQIITVPLPDSMDASVPASSTGTYYVVVISSETLGTFRIRINPGSDIYLRDGPSNVVQEISGAGILDTSSTTVITPPPSINSAFPFELPGGIDSGIEISANVWHSATSSMVYVGSNDGIFYSIDLNGGGIKWQFSTGSHIKSAPWVEEESGSFYIYFANDAGNVYKVKDLGTSYQVTSPGWTRSLATIIRSGIVQSGSKVYGGTNDNKLYCLNKSDGLNCANWTFDTAINAPISGSPSVDESSFNGLYKGWVGLETGNLMLFRSTDGVVTNTLVTGQVKTSPYYDGGWGGANNNVYITSIEGSTGKLWARTYLTGITTPPDWVDYPTNAPIYSSPNMDLWSPNGRKYVYFGDDSGKLYKVDASSGQVVWSYQAGGPIRTMPAIAPGSFFGLAQNYVYFGSDDSNIYCLNTETGALRDNWPVQTGGAVRGDLVLDVDNRTLIAVSTDGKVYVIKIGP